MPKPPTVSIVIPALNEERRLRACLQTIANQTIQPLEAIVVDNGSSDNTAAVALSFPFVRLVREPRQGLVLARDTGFNAARGDVIGRIDADVLLPPAWIQHIQAFYADSDNKDRIWSGGGHFYNMRPAWLVDWAYYLLAFRFNESLLGHCTLWGSNMAMLRSHWYGLRGEVCHRADIHEDLDLALHAARRGHTIAYDSSNKVSAKLRRVHSGRHELWKYLQLWPRTLRVHGVASWFVCWFLGAFMLYIATFVLLAIELSWRTLDQLNADSPLSRPAGLPSHKSPQD